MTRRGAARSWLALAAAALALSAASARAAEPAPCRVDGVSYEVRCGSVRRPLDAAAPAGKAIDVHYVVVPAITRRALPDPVFFLAGGPGQSAIDVAGPMSRLLGRLVNRRDLVFVDQRGTGRSASLACPEDDARDPAAPLAERLDTARQVAALKRCLQALQAKPHGDLRHYTTEVASADLDAVRAELGAERIDLVGVSYGTRAALDYMRQFPARVRRVVLDGVAPPDMVLPAAGALDGPAALERWLADCEADAGCNARLPGLRAQWQQLGEGLPREVSVLHPYTGRPERVTLTRDMLQAAVRGALYVPAMAAGLPQALHEAAQGRLEPLLGLASVATPVGRGIASGMHFSVLCAEDVPRMDPAALAAAEGPAALYREVCAGWPRAAVSSAFYTVPPAPAATLLLSGGRDPATPPRHAERVARALGAKARHLVVPQAGHGVMSQPCGSALVADFIAAADDEAALRAEPGCLLGLPAPRPFRPPEAGR